MATQVCVILGCIGFITRLLQDIIITHKWQNGWPLITYLMGKYYIKCISVQLLKSKRRNHDLSGNEESFKDNNTSTVGWVGVGGEGSSIALMLNRIFASGVLIW